MNELEYLSQLIQAQRNFCNHLNGTMIQMHIEKEASPSPRRDKHYYRMKRLQREMTKMTTRSNRLIAEYQKKYQMILNDQPTKGRF